ncbi:MAG TPA: alpha/beta hydrolase-fold protein [Longimicrobiales bacterium]|nr:alpha/beta hydrolase-fold protein [Longimicrobiales bacterium]
MRGAALVFAGFVLAGALPLSLPASAPAQRPALDRPAAGAAPAGRLDTLRIASRFIGDTLVVPVYAPRGYVPGRGMPAVYAVASQVFFDQPRVRLAAVVDSATAAGAPPALWVGVPFGPEAGGHHPDTPAGERYRRFVVEELVPAVERRYAPAADRDGRALLGFSSGANIAIDLGALHPARFGRVAAISPGWMDRAADGVAIGEVFLDSAMAHVRRAATPLPRLWIVWGDGSMEWEARSREHGRRMLAALAERGAAVQHAPELPGDHGLGLAAGGLPPAIGFLLGPAAAGPRAVGRPDPGP